MGSRPRSMSRVSYLMIAPQRRPAAHSIFGLLVALLAATGIPGVPASLSAQGTPVAVTFLDVGQGDAIVIRAPDGRFAMIDAGRGSPLRQLTRLGVDELALLVATHAHVDHIGGLDDVLTARPVETYLDNGTPHTTRAYLDLMAHVERLNLRYLRALPRSLLLGGVSLEILPLPASTEEQNDRSVGIILRYGDFSALLTGDSEREELDFWSDQGLIPDVTLLKAAHHGASNGFTYVFLEAAQPELVVISVGEGNSYGHPRPDALAAYTSYADEVLRTDRDGTVTIFGHSDGRYDVVLGDDPYNVEAQSGSEAVPIPASSWAWSRRVSRARGLALFSASRFRPMPVARTRITSTTSTWSSKIEVGRDSVSASGACATSRVAASAFLRGPASGRAGASSSTPGMGRPTGSHSS